MSPHAYSSVPLTVLAAIVFCTLQCHALTLQCNGKNNADCNDEFGKISSEESDKLITPSIKEESLKVLTLDKTKISSNETSHVDVDNKQISRVLKMDVNELQSLLNAIHNQTADKKNNKQNKIDLSDVSMEDDEDFSTQNVNNDESIVGKVDIKDKNSIVCIDNSKMYKYKETIERGCDEICVCNIIGKFECKPKCELPFFRRGRKIDDPSCFERPVDKCCAILLCPEDVKESETLGPISKCRHGNRTYSVGDHWDIGCDEICTCETASVVVCKPRCHRIETKDQCINVQDPNDECCQVQVCDVSHDIHEEVDTTIEPEIQNATIQDRSDDFIELPVASNNSTSNAIDSIEVLQNNSVKVNLKSPMTELEISENGGKTYEVVMLDKYNLLRGLKPGVTYMLRSSKSEKEIQFSLSSSGHAVDKTANDTVTTNMTGCHFDGKYYEVGEEFRIGCKQLCECIGFDVKECANIDCPSHVGLELISASCVKWAPDPEDWMPEPPHCCPPAMKCLSNGSCNYMGHVIPNWSEVPISLSGCEERCFCESGTLDCQNICSPVPEVPPNDLHCEPGLKPAIVNISDDDCCKQWDCEHSAPFVEEMNPYTWDHMHKTYQSNYVTLSTHQIHTPPPSSHDNIYPDMEFINTPNKNSKPNDSSKTLYKFPGPWADPFPSNSPIDYFPKEIMPPKENNNYNPYSNNHFNINNKANFHTTFPPKILTTNNREVNFVTMPSINTNINSVKIPQNNKTKYQFNEKRDNMQQIIQNDFTKKSTKQSQNIPFIVNQTTKRPYILQKVKKEKNTLTQTNAEKFEPKTNKYTEVADLLKELESGPTTKGDQVEDLRLTQSDIRDSGEKIPNYHDSINKPQDLFIPTIRPNIHFPIDEELPDYDSTNAIRPGNIPQRPPAPPIFPTIPPGIFGTPPTNSLPNFPSIPTTITDLVADNKKLVVLSLSSDTPSSVKLLFGLPAILVGLKGSVDLRYTDTEDNDINHWQSQIFAPSDEVLTTSRLEFRLTGLKSSTVYKIMGKLNLNDFPVQPVSGVYTVRTLDPLIEEKRRSVDSQLTVIGVNATNAQLTWRHFTRDELKYIDGIQVRYRPVEQPIYQTTELLHNSRSSVFLSYLKPDTQYEASLVLIPPTDVNTELYDPSHVKFITPEYIDIYNWSITLDAKSIGSHAVELTWRGVPVPAERYVRIYRAAHTCRRDHLEQTDSFKLATRDQEPSMLLSGLEPSSRCRVWVELFLTNGKVKMSNVLDIVTKSEDTQDLIDNVAEASIAGSSQTGRKSDYYGALVVTGVVAALGALASLLLLLVVVRRHRPHSVSITTVPSAPRESSLPPYDNPAYKVELQQETMDL